VDSPSGNSSYAKDDNGVSSNEDKENQVKTVLPSTSVSKGVSSQEYDTPIVALLEGNNSKRVALMKKKKGVHPLVTILQLTVIMIVILNVNEGRFFFLFLFCMSRH
jgi:hypothetical protein